MTTQADSPAVHEVIASEALATFYDSRFTEFFAVTTDPGSRELVTMEFYEKRPDLGDIQLLKQVSWDITVPPGAQLFAAASGLLRDHVNAFWVGWRTPDTLSALSVYQESPVNVPLDAATKLAQPPVILPDKSMIQYYWQPKGETWVLSSYEFHGSQGEQKGVTQTRRGHIDHEPVFSAAIPLPGAEDNRSAVGWVEQSGTGIIIGSMLCVGDASEQITTLAIPFITPLPHQRLAMHAGTSGRITVGLIAESSLGGYVVIEAVFDFAAHLFTFHTDSLHASPGTIHSACLFYLKNQVERKAFVCMLSADGVLSTTRPGSNHVQTVRAHVDPEYDFPVLTSSSGRYEAGRPGRQIELFMLP